MCYITENVWMYCILHMIRTYDILCVHNLPLQKFINIDTEL